MTRGGIAIRARLRVEEAKNLPKSSKPGISEIAIALRFLPFGQFNRTFHRIACILPRVYRTARIRTLKNAQFIRADE